VYFPIPCTFPFFARPYHPNFIKGPNNSFFLANYDVEAIHTIVNTTPVVHVSFQPSDPSEGPFPAILPMIGQMGSFERPSAGLEDPLDCYLHGYVSSRMMKNAQSNAKGEELQGLPITISATKFDGMVLSLTPFSHSYNYRSVVLFGYATPVTDKDEKMWAMELITNSVIPGRWDQTRVPPDAGELASTTILRVRIVSGSGKIREGEPHDDKKDLGRDDLVNKVWTGVVPVWQTVGEPVAGKANRVSEIPGYLRDFRDGENETNEKYAMEAAEE